MEKLNLRGQSSVTDALFFFTIVSAVSLFLFVFANGYGETLKSQADREQFREYVSSALKVIMYSGTPRNSTIFLENNPPEKDFLMAAVKEDLADDGTLDETADIIKNTVAGIMNPLSESVDYIFYFYLSSQTQNQIPYFIFYKSVSINYAAGDSAAEKETKFNNSACNEGPPGVDPANPREYAAFLAGGCHVFEYCNPKVIGNVDQFFYFLPNVARTTSQTSFLSAPVVPGPQPDPIDGEVSFSVWPSTAAISNQGYLALDCCRAADASCKNTIFVSQSALAGGVQLTSFTPLVKLDYIGANQWASKNISFFVKNNSLSDSKSIQISIDPSTPECNQWIQFSGGTPSFSLDPALAVPLSDLRSSDPAVSHITEGYFIHLGQDTEWSAATKNDVLSALYGAGDDFAPTLFKRAAVQATIQLPNVNEPFIKVCKFRLTVNGADNPPVQLTITRDTPAS